MYPPSSLALRVAVINLYCFSARIHGGRGACRLRTISPPKTRPMKTRTTPTPSFRLAVTNGVDGGRESASHSSRFGLFWGEQVLGTGLCKEVPPYLAQEGEWEETCLWCVCADSKTNRATVSQSVSQSIPLPVYASVTLLVFRAAPRAPASLHYSLLFSSCCFTHIEMGNVHSAFFCACACCVCWFSVGCCLVFRLVPN